jgi:hypothetical protein
MGRKANQIATTPITGRFQSVIAPQAGYGPVPAAPDPPQLRSHHGRRAVTRTAQGRRSRHLTQPKYPPIRLLSFRAAALLPLGRKTATEDRCELPLAPGKSVMRVPPQESRGSSNSRKDCVRKGSAFRPLSAHNNWIASRPAGTAADLGVMRPPCGRRPALVIGDQRAPPLRESRGDHASWFRQT